MCNQGSIFIFKNIFDKFKKNKASPPEIDSIFSIQEKVIHELVVNTPNEWERIILNFEYFHWDGDYIEKYQGFAFTPDGKEQIHPSLETFDELILLNKEMAKNNPEPWTHCEIELNSLGKYEYNFKYRMPPFTKQMLENIGEI